MKHSRISVALAIAAFVAAVTGCSRVPTAPAVNAANLTQAGGGTGSNIERIDDVPLPIVGQAGLVNFITLDGAHDGTLTVGRFTLVIQKNTLKIPATIAMIVPDTSVMRVEFEVTPARANDFAVPAQLIADCSNEPLEHVMNETLYWWDGFWKEAPAASVYHSERTITTLAHDLRSGVIELRGEGGGNRLDDPNLPLP
jgi:hypothetical protein